MERRTTKLAEALVGFGPYYRLLGEFTSPQEKLGAMRSSSLTMRKRFGFSSVRGLAGFGFS